MLTPLASNFVNFPLHQIRLKLVSDRYKDSKSTHLLPARLQFQSLNIPSQIILTNLNKGLEDA